MAYEVTVDNTKYRVDAPDEVTAWHWANAEHDRTRPERMKIPPAVDAARKKEGARLTDLAVQGKEAEAGLIPASTVLSPPGTAAPPRDSLPNPPAALPRAGAAGAVTPPTAGVPNLDNPTAPPQEYIPNQFGSKLDKYIASLPDIQSTPVGRFIRGQSDLPIGVMQAAAHLVPGLGPVVDKKLAETFAKSKPPDGEFDWARLAGNIINPASGAAGSTLLRGANLGERMAGGSALGTILGAGSPTEGEGPYGAEKVKQVLTGNLIGSAIPAAVSGIKSVGAAGRDILDLVAPGGAGRIASRYMDRIIGPEGVEKVKQALLNVRELVPGSKPTASQAVSELPEGSPLIAQQNITARTPGGPSALFGQRKLDQEAAREVALKERDKITDPIRERALDRANLGGGASLQDIVDGLTSITLDPGVGSSKLVQRTVRQVARDLKDVTRPDGTIDARALYTKRKELGNTIEYFSRETANFDKKLAAGLQIDLQKAMDAAIESAENRALQAGPPGGASGAVGTAVGRQRSELGPASRDIPGQATVVGTETLGPAPTQGPEWRKYLSEYATRSKGVEEDIARAKAALRPIQRTDLQGGVNIAEETRTHLPNMLSRPMMGANWALKTLAGTKSGIEPRLDRVMAERFLDPQQLAASLNNIPLQQRGSIIRALLERGLLQGAQSQQIPLGE